MQMPSHHRHVLSATCWPKAGQSPSDFPSFQTRPRSEHRPTGQDPGHSDGPSHRAIGPGRRHPSDRVTTHDSDDSPARGRRCGGGSRRPDSDPGRARATVTAAVTVTCQCRASLSAAATVTRAASHGDLPRQCPGHRDSDRVTARQSRSPVTVTRGRASLSDCQ
jgi:hypothetical protein